MAFNQVGRIALLQLDRLVIARVLSLSMAAYYAVPFGISQRLNMLGAAAATVAFPHSSASTARGELDDFRGQYLQTARVVCWLTLAPSLAVIVLADQILRYWMSPEFAIHGTLPLRLLAVGILWISVASLDAVSIEGSGRPWVTSVFMAIAGVANLVGLLVLTPRWGLGGAAASVTLAFLALASLDMIAKEMVKGNGSTIGLPNLRAGSRVDMDGMGERFSGSYFVTATTHAIGDGGYTTNFECRREGNLKGLQ